ncbi:MAG: hypothetical protein RIC14_16945 [Filomicrobium sp.]
MIRNAITALLPIAIIGLLTATAATTWLSHAPSSLALALLPAAALHFWALRHPQLIPGLAVLFSGLAIDIVFAGPMGLWTTVYASAWLIGLLQRPSAEHSWLLSRWGMFAIAMTGCIVVLAGLGEALSAPPGTLIDHLLALTILIAGYPLFAALMRLFEPHTSADRFSPQNG